MSPQLSQVKDVAVADEGGSRGQSLDVVGERLLSQGLASLCLIRMSLGKGGGVRGLHSGARCKFRRTVITRRIYFHFLLSLWSSSRQAPFTSSMHCCKNSCPSEPMMWSNASVHPSLYLKSKSEVGKPAFGVANRDLFGGGPASCSSSMPSLLDTLCEQQKAKLKHNLRAARERVLLPRWLRSY